MKVLDLFCGAGGATVGMSLLGMDVVGVDYDADACRTHAAAGHPTIRADIGDTLPIRGDFDGVWASPPCTAFSMAGKGEGREHADRLVECIMAEDLAPWPDIDPTVWLVLPTLAHVLSIGPRWTAWENVPATQPVMDAVCRVLERYGYSARTVVLSSERFGVAQTRKRCFIVAGRDGVTMPEPTHQAYTHGEPAAAEMSLFGEVLPWVSMADALGWGTPERPGFTLALGGESADTTGGGSGARAALRDLASRESWVMDRRCTNKDGSPVPPVPSSSPSPSLTVSGLGGGQFVWRSDPMDNACVRELDQPAGTIKMGHEPPSWVEHRPATTIAGDPRCFQPGGHHEPGQQSENAIRLTIGEAARLQAFPHGHPWQGSRTSTFKQIGNAVPCPMGAVVAGSAAGIDWHQPVADYLADLYASPLEVEAAA